VSALGEINSKNRGIITGKNQINKIIINLGVAAYEQSNVVGERFSADDSII
jgi:hypothetical protein